MANCDFIKDNKCTLTNIDNSVSPKLNLNKLNLDEDFCENPAIVIIGKRGSGKTTLIINLIQHFNSDADVENVLIFCPTDKHQSKYSKLTDTVYDAYDSELLSQILQERQHNPAKLKEKLLIVFDDCIQQSFLTKDQYIQELLYNGRHYNISFILSLQYSMGFSPGIRCNFDYIFLLAEDFISSQKRLYDHYAGMFPTFVSFRDTLADYTKNFNSLVLINRSSHTNIFNKVKYFKANENTENFFIKSVKKDIEQNSQDIDDISMCSIKLSEKNNITSKTKYDVFCSVLDCNKLLLQSSNIPIDIKNIILETNLKIISLCGSCDSCNCE